MNEIIESILQTNRILLNTVENLQARIKRLERDHIHHQNVYQAGSTGEQVYPVEKEEADENTAEL